jgi:hypothetical protein
MNKQQFINEITANGDNFHVELAKAEYAEGITQLTFIRTTTDRDGNAWSMFDRVYTFITTGTIETNMMSVFEDNDCLPMTVTDVVFIDDIGLLIMLEKEDYELWMSLAPEDIPANYEYFMWKGEKG